MYKAYDKAQAIKNVQIYLDKARQSTFAVVPSGIYDDKTRLAVLDFQKRFNLLESGIVDSATLKKLYNEYLLKLQKTDLENRGFSLPFYSGDFSGEIQWLNRGFIKLMNHYGESHSIKPNGYFSSETEAAAKTLSRIYQIDYPGYINEILFTRLIRDLESL